jgi:hypothetical protein
MLSVSAELRRLVVANEFGRKMQPTSTGEW